VRLFVSWLSLRKVSPSLSLSHFIFFVLVGQQRRRLSGYWSSLQLYSWFRWTHFAVPFWILFSWFLLRHIPIPISASNSTIYTCSPEFLYDGFSANKASWRLTPFRFSGLLWRMSPSARWVSIIMTLESNTCGPPVSVCRSGWDAFFRQEQLIMVSRRD